MKNSYFRFLIAAFFIVALSPAGRADTLAYDTKDLPDQLGGYRARGPIVPAPLPDTLPAEIDTLGWIRRTYVAPNGSSMNVFLYPTGSDSGAYSLLTMRAPTTDIKFRDVGLASVITPSRVFFSKGRNFVIVEASKAAPEDVLDLAREFAKTLDPGHNDLPVLVKHLPNWETARVGAEYVTTLRALKKLFPTEPVLHVVSFEAGAEAVAATYTSPERKVGELLIIEFTTPQHASDNDRFINAKLNELRNEGSPHVPTAYRRVGNYAVFVFNGADTQAANKLIDEVKYEQVTQWLGDNPYPLLDAQREYVATTLGVFVSVVNLTGIAILVCLSVGGLFGGLLFMKRRSQLRAVESYSDAGGMLRLNLDEMTGKPDPARLIGPTN